MSYDLLIKNGTVVDGTGAPQYRADVAVANGKIAEIGKITEGAKKVIDASDLIVAPGFVDPHTHYDAQICWDPLITSSSWHGVTSLVMGNCGVGIAPCRPEVREIAAWDLVNVEAIPFDVLTKGITWDWETFLSTWMRHKSAAAASTLGSWPAHPIPSLCDGRESMDRPATRKKPRRSKR
jgi:N-acyl-D-aspartate/D-glutamate deacylase